MPAMPVGRRSAPVSGTTDLVHAWSLWSLLCEERAEEGEALVVIISSAFRFIAIMVEGRRVRS